MNALIKVRVSGVNSSSLHYFLKHCMHILGSETPIPHFTGIVQNTCPYVTVPELWLDPAPSRVLSLKHPIHMKRLWSLELPLSKSAATISSPSVICYSNLYNKPQMKSHQFLDFGSEPHTSFSGGISHGPSTC